MPRYKVTVNFQGLVTIDMDAATLEAAHQDAKELTIADIARPGNTDMIKLHMAVREIVPATGSEEEEDLEDSAGASKPRPSGWYRPA